MKSIARVAAVLASVALPLSASAGSEDFGWYVQGGGAITFGHDSDVDLEIAAVSTEVDFEEGWGVAGAGGVKHSSGLRGEIELGFRTNEIDALSVNGGGGVTASGDYQAWTGMANVFFDFDNSTRVTPYIGLGAGVGIIDVDGSAAGISTDDAFFAVLGQAIAGIDIEITDNISIFGDYRFITTLNDNLKENAEFNINATTKADFDVDYHNSALFAGVRFYFSKPEMAPKAPRFSTGNKSRSYLVFFDFNRDDLTAESKEIIRRAVEDSSDERVLRFEVVGHADRSGSADYNQGLSKRRADAVRNYLASLGIESGDIDTSAKGESSPLVPTADGVAEPQNRRAEIVYTVR